MLPVLRTGLPFSHFAISPFGRLDTFFERAFGDEPRGPHGQDRARSPMPLAMWQDENNHYIEAEMPGVLEKELEVTVHGDLLSIKALRHEPEGRKYTFNRRSFGRFERAVALPEAVETDRIEAMLADGVLSLTLPKKAEARPRKIAVKNR